MDSNTPVLTHQQRLEEIDAALTQVAAALHPAVTKFCIDCKWAKQFEPYDHWRCTSPEIPTDPVNGVKARWACSLLRGSRVTPRGTPSCTINGHWFVAKEGGA